MIDFLFNLKGRVSRKGYLLGLLLPFLLITELLPRTVPGSAGMLGILGVLLLWPAYVAVPVKRFHDMGLSGWYQAGFLGLMVLSVMILVNGIREVSGDAILSVTSAAEQQRIIQSALEESGRARLGLGLLALVRIAQIALFLAVRGQPQGNDYGNDPLASGRGFAD